MNPKKQKPRLGPNPAEVIVPTQKDDGPTKTLTQEQVKTIRLRLQVLAEEQPDDGRLKKLRACVKQWGETPTLTLSQAAETLGGEAMLDVLLAKSVLPVLPPDVMLSRYRYFRHRTYHRQLEDGSWESIGTKQDMERHLRSQGCSRSRPQKSVCSLSQVETALELISQKYSVESLPGFPPNPESNTDSEQGSSLEVYFCRADEKYYWKSDASHQWEPLCRRAFEDIAACRGVALRPREGHDVSAFTRLVSRIHAERTVEFVAELSGYPAGVHEIKTDTTNVTRVLCPRGVRLPTAHAGEFPTILRVLDAALSHDEHGPAQVETLHLFLAEARQAIAGQDRTRQAPGLGLIGQANSGKSLIQNTIIKHLLGGRMALAYPYLAGKTDKNGDMSKVEILHCEDSSIRYTFEERSAFGQSIKEIVGNQTQRVRAMYREATAQQPIWRIIITANSESNYWQILPPLDATLEGKLSLLFAATATKTKSLVAEVGGPEALAACIAQELPAYAHFLDTYAVPDERLNARHRYTAFVHPVLRDLLQEERPEFALLELMQARFFSGPEGRAWKGSATDIDQKLSSSSEPGVFSQNGVEKTFAKLAGRSPMQLGRLLTDLAENSGGIVVAKKERVPGGTGRKVYIVQPPSKEQWAALRHLRPTDLESSEDFEADLSEVEQDEVLRDRPLS